MVAKTVKGARVNVKLPWKGISDNKEQIVRMKRPVAKLLGFDIVKTSELLFDTKIQEKDEPDKKVSGFQSIQRVRLAGYKQRSFTVFFEEPVKPQGEGNTKSFSSVSFPVTTSTAVLDVIKYFEGAIGGRLKVVKLKTDRGQTYPITT